MASSGEGLGSLEQAQEEDFSIRRLDKFSDMDVEIGDFLYGVLWVLNMSRCAVIYFIYLINFWVIMFTLYCDLH